MYHNARGEVPADNVDTVMTLDQVPKWSDADQRAWLQCDGDDPSFSYDPLTSSPENGSLGNEVSRFPMDVVVNSTNENLDEAHSSPALHAAVGSNLTEECATMVGCQTRKAKVTKAYDLPARRIIHIVGPKYAIKYHTAAENALSHCYRSCLELLIENGLQSIAMVCKYTEAKNYPHEPAAHVAIRTVSMLKITTEGRSPTEERWRSK
uniref:Macro domain-containing protein n=1 Tax=Kalanchoe fedtschenkoi TaxID=63787 RepID=A0A7N0TCW8_KALFE